MQAFVIINQHPVVMWMLFTVQSIDLVDAFILLGEPSLLLEGNI